MSGLTWGLWGLLFQGLWVTVQLTVLSAALGAVFAFGAGIARTHRLRLVRFLAGAYTEGFRGTSALVLMFWVFFVLPIAFGWQLVPMWAAVLSLSLTYGAYGSEVVRGALQAVPAAQQEAGIALGFSPWQQLTKILLPQALPEMIPPANNLLIELLKGTALASVLGVSDISFRALLVRHALGYSISIYSVVLVMYFVLAFAFTRGMRALERHAKAGMGQAPPEKGPSVLRRLNVRQRAGSSRDLTSAGGA